MRSTIGSDAASGSSEAKGSLVSSIAHKLRFLTSTGWHRIATVNAWTLVVYVASFLYMLVIGYVSVSKYYTFNVTFTSLGVDDRTLWLLSHGGFSAYFNSGFNSAYAFPIQKWILFVYLPIYAAVPSILTTIILQTVVIAVAAIPLYYFARAALKSAALGGVIALLYLVYYPLTANNLVGEIAISWFPLLIFATAAALATGRTRWGYGFALMAAGTDFLALLIILMLIFFGFPVATRTMRRTSWLSALVRDLRYNALKTISLAALVVCAIAYHFASAYTLPSSSQATGQTVVQFLLFDYNLKILFFFYLLVPVAFLSILDRLTLLTLFPFVIFIFYSESPGTYIPFGHQYVIMAGAILFVGLVRVLARMRPTEGLRQGTDQPARQNCVAANWRLSLESDRLRFYTTFGVVVALSSLFGVIYMPVSPVNQYVQGGYFSGNQDVKTYTTSTSQTRFLWKAIHLIPPDASVVTQNNILQLEDRYYYQIASLLAPGIPYDYILMDTALDYFAEADIAKMIVLLNQYLPNGTFGILAEGEGALLAERGFHAPPATFVPFDETYVSSNLALSSGVAVGSEIVDSKGGPVMWFGPYVALFPGKYSATFAVSVNTTEPANASALTLQVTSAGGTIVYNTTSLNRGDFRAYGQWTQFTLNFSLENIVQGVELRGVGPSAGLTISLRDITLTQLS